MRQLYFFIVFALTAAKVIAQPTTEKELRASYEVRRKLAETSILKNYPARSLGPTAPGGRVVDIDVNPNNYKEFYVALASGGVFKTINNGVSFHPVFDNQDALGIGDIAVCPVAPEILFVGTGEKNSSRSCYAGSGLYKSMDGGKTWEFSGLAGTHHISRIVFHPKDKDIVWVGAAGALFSRNQDRGLYKTTDGGKTWRKTLYINDSTGVIDVAVHPGNPSLLLATAWERTRSSSNFKSSGEGSSIYRSEDGGESWVRSNDGFAQGLNVGRIGLSVCLGKPDVTYAVLDNQLEVSDARKEKKLTEEKALLQKIRSMSKNDLMNAEDAFLEDILGRFHVQQQYTPAVVKQDVRDGKYHPKMLASYFEDFLSASTRILGAETYRSDDFGKSWRKMNESDLDGVFHSYGYYFGEIAVSPEDPDLVYLQGIPLLKSRDGGKTWHRLDTIRTPREVHVDHHAMWINPKDPAHMLLGNDGGLYQSYDEGATWLHLNSIPAGQFYTVNVDLEKPYNVYGGMQDNGVWKGSSDGGYWKQLFSGDGMFVVPDPKDNHTIFTGYQFGNYFRMELDKKKSTKISPLHQVTESMLRWNWRAPLIMSRHNGNLYIGANRVFQSTDKGESWTGISLDLTKNRKQGNVPSSTISAIAESPMKPGLLYVGTDDGSVWVSPDKGANWNVITQGLPDKFVSGIFPSPHEEATVFISLNGFREDDFKTYLFMSQDFGKSWTSVKGNLPESVANIVLQDPVNPDLLYCGLDNGTYASLDKGVTWHVFNNLLNVAAYDMVVHPTENELVVGTHGRGLFIVDVKPLQALKDTGKKVVVGMSPSKIKFSDNWGQKKYSWSKKEKPNGQFMFFARKAGKTNVEIRDSSQNTIRKFDYPAVIGFNILNWDLTTDDSGTRFLEKGSYTITYTIDKQKDTVDFKVD